MAIIITAPLEKFSIKNNENKKLFLAGGITGCADWQSIVIKELKDIEDLTIFNPRRKVFPMDNPNEAERQIVWEYNKLKESDYISFWFAKGTDNPIVLYELGKWGTSTNKKIIVGIETGYSRKQDVIIQTRLARPEVKVYEYKNVINFSDQIRCLIAGDYL